jgi:formylglycine-generating enzyme required for sulfatase activity
MRFVMISLSLLSLLLSGGGFSAQAAGKTCTNSIGMEFVLIPAGSFVMGADRSVEREAFDVETPPHRVTISKPFYLGKYEVTQAQWEEIMGNNPSKFEGRSNPVEQVSWDDVQMFIQRLNRQEGHNRYRLPTEAEWEYAARAGSASAYSFGDNAKNLDRYAWYARNSGVWWKLGDLVTHPVGQKAPNPWGLYDMHGNVGEWVQDWYAHRYYSHSPGTDPRGPSSGSYRVQRGGAYYSYEYNCRSASRADAAPGNSDEGVGFRLALSPE